MPNKEKKRGGLLTFWLIIMLISYVFAFFGWLFLNPMISATYSNVSPWISIIYEMLSFVGLFAIIFLFMWKKGAFYVICGISIISFFLNIYLMGIKMIVIFGLLYPIILYLIMRPKWKLFE